MHSVFWIARREFSAYWTSPLAYVVLALFGVLSGILFFANLNSFVAFSQAPGRPEVDVNALLIRPYLYSLSIVILFLMPMLTMRLLAEERRQGTLEILLTTPTTESSIVFGKFLGALGLYTVMLFFPMLHMLLLFLLGNPDVPPVVTSLAGLFMLGAVYLSLGLFLSSVTQNQILAAAASFSLFLLLWLLDTLSQFAPAGTQPLLHYLSLAGHFDNFAKGVVSSVDLVFYISLILGGLFAATQSVAAVRWKP